MTDSPVVIVQIEVSATKGFDSPDGIETCNKVLPQAEAFSVYIRTPYAFHLQDFPIEKGSSVTQMNSNTMIALERAVEWGKALAHHLGCNIQIMGQDHDSFNVGRPNFLKKES